MAEDQRNARIFGVLFLITFVTSIPALALFQPVLDDPAGYIAGGGEDNQIYLGAFLELLLIIANIGTAVVVFPILRRQNEILVARLCHGSYRRVRLHRRRHPLRPRDRHAAAGLRPDAASTRRSRSLRSRTGRSCSAPGFIVGWGTG